MEITDVLDHNAVIADLKVNSKKQALQELAKWLANIIGFHERAIFDLLLERERLGTTGIGNGIAIPHARLAGLEKPYGLFARLKKPVDFDSIDEYPVDLIFLLVAPESAGADHLKALACISRLLRDADICEKLRGTEKKEALFALLTENSARNAA